MLLTTQSKTLYFELQNKNQNIFEKKILKKDCRSGNPFCFFMGSVQCID